MEEFYRCLGIRKKLLCFLLCIFSAAEANSTMKVVGSEVTLPCRNESLNSLTQLTWTMNGILLFSYVPQKPLHTAPKAQNLTLNMSLSEDRLYELIIERVDKSHTGNYTCESSTSAGALEQRWQLIITDADQAEETNPLILVAVIVPCVCCLIFIFTLTIMRRRCKPQAENSSSPTAEQKEIETTYENYLEVDGGCRLQHRAQ